MKVQIGDKLVDAELNEAGVPIVKTWSEEIRHADGRVDVIVHVPCLKIQAKENDPK